uniref:FXYD domain-containing ion transport regulator n=1 Tax=Paramormyrops kingsleyae TaxID=1676925 RepID=A0A3B3RVA3_9TELE
MGRFSALVLLAGKETPQLESLFFFFYYERLRIGGLVFTCLLVAGGISVLLWNKCKGTK